MILSYADINDQQKMKRVKRAYEDGKVRERDTDLNCATRICVYALHLSKQDTFSHPKYHSCMHFSTSEMRTPLRSALQQLQIEIDINSTFVLDANTEVWELN